MATQQLGKIEFSRTLHGGPPPKIEFLEAANQTYEVGDPVYLVSGLVTTVADDPAVILGIAQKAATGTTNAVAPVMLADPETVFKGNVALDGDADADDDTTQAAVGLRHGLVKIGSDFHVDLDSSSTNKVVIILGEARPRKPDFSDSDATSDSGFDVGGTITDIYAMVEFVFDPTFYQLHTAATDLS